MFFNLLFLDIMFTLNSHTSLQNYENYKLRKSLQNVAKGKEYVFQKFLLNIHEHF